MQIAPPFFDDVYEMEDNKMSHTPGPWEYTELLADGTMVNRGGRFEIRTDNYDVCAFIPGSAPIRNEDDARLISAAPDLLATLEGLLAVVNVRIDDPRIQQFDNARAAIAKARGA